MNSVAAVFKFLCLVDGVIFHLTISSHKRFFCSPIVFKKISIVLDSRSDFSKAIFFPPLHWHVVAQALKCESVVVKSRGEEKSRIVFAFVVSLMRTHAP